MGVFLGQLPPAELARLKAELAETLIANFCYPRFFDHRTNSLRMRPVGRTKRQEVWLYLSSIDFTPWNRVDLTTLDFQRHIERLIISFVQRNRSFFGLQGRKRMSDVRMLISSCSLIVAEGMRSHLMGRQSGNQPFGSPRPSISWSTTNDSGRPEANWEQIVSATMIMQQQLQEVRGEIKSATIPLNDIQQTPQRTNQGQKVENGVSSRGHEVSLLATEQVSNGKHATQVSGNGVSTSVSVNGGKPLNVAGTSMTPSDSSIVASPRPTKEAPVPFVETPTIPTPIIETSVARRSPEIAPASSAVPEQIQSATIPTTPSAQSWGLVRSSQTPQSPYVPPKTTQLSPPTPVAGVTVNPTRSAAPASSEDIAIFERMHQQLVLWLRIEAVRLDLDIIAGQTPLQLLEVLRHHSSFDQTRLQIVSTLLNLSTQVMKTGQADLLDYKQAMMFYLMHTQP